MKYNQPLTKKALPISKTADNAKMKMLEKLNNKCNNLASATTELKKSTEIFQNKISQQFSLKNSNNPTTKKLSKYELLRIQAEMGIIDLY